MILKKKVWGRVVVMGWEGGWCGEGGHMGVGGGEGASSPKWGVGSLTVRGGVGTAGGGLQSIQGKTDLTII